MYWNDLENVLRDYLSIPSKETTYIAVPFINPELLESVLQPKWNQKVVVITSWRKDHLLTGVSKIEIYDVVKRHPKWSLLVNDRVHSKIYSNDLISALVGSANLSYTALQDGSRSNHEVLTYIELSDSDRSSFQKLLKDSNLVNDEYHQKCLDWYNENKNNFPKLPIDSVIPEKDKDWFLISSLPASTSPTRIWEIMVDSSPADKSWGEYEAAKHDLDLFEINCTDHENFQEFRTELSQQVSAHPFITAFTENIDSEGLYFGRAKEWIQRNCTDVPVPYRRDITEYAQALYVWLPELFPEHFSVNRPNYSQIIRRKI